MVTPRTSSGRFAKAQEAETPDPTPAAEVPASEPDEAVIAPTLDEALPDATGDPGVIADEADAVAVILDATVEIDLVAHIFDGVASGRLDPKAIADGLRGA
jgi:hypothetical protein